MRIFIVLSRFPYPLEKGDKLRAYHQIKHLAKNHEIILCCLTVNNVKESHKRELLKHCSHLYIFKLSKIKVAFNLLKAFFSKKPFQVHYFYDKKIQKSIDEVIVKHVPKRIYCQLIRVTEYVKKYSIIPKTLDYMDALSKGMERRMEVSNIILRPFIKLEYRRLVEYESHIFDHFESKTIISTQDLNELKHPSKKNIHVIPNGIDCAHFKPLEIPKEYDIVFIGNMAYPPNIESGTMIVKKILPKLRKNNNAIKVLLSGANPHFRIRSLESKSVHVTGWVEDIRESYAKGRVFLAPMTIGTGLQNKLLEAMAMKLPCITSELANNSLGAVEGSEILVGTTNNEYAEHVSRLLNDQTFYEKIAKNGYNFVIKKFNWKTTSERLESIIIGQI